MTREKVITQEPMNGGVSCPLSTVIETNGCYDMPCNDCDVPSNGPNGYPCFNGGACVDLVQFDASFSCNCSGTGFSGSNCQTSPGDCTLASYGPHGKSCLNLGTCVYSTPYNGHYTCDCSQVPFSGDNCEIENYSQIPPQVLPIQSTGDSITVVVPPIGIASVTSASIQVLPLSVGDVTFINDTVALDIDYYTSIYDSTDLSRVLTASVEPGARTVLIDGLAPSTLYLIRLVLITSSATLNGSIALAGTLQPSVDAISLAFDGDFVSVFGAVASKSLIQGFTQALVEDLQSFNVSTSQIYSINVIPGSIVVIITGSTAAIAQIRQLALLQLISFTFNGQLFSQVINLSNQMLPQVAANSAQSSNLGLIIGVAIGVICGVLLLLIVVVAVRRSRPRGVKPSPIMTTDLSLFKSYTRDLKQRVVQNDAYGYAADVVGGSVVDGAHQSTYSHMSTEFTNIEATAEYDTLMVDRQQNQQSKATGYDSLRPQQDSNYLTVQNLQKDDSYLELQYASASQQKALYSTPNNISVGQETDTDVEPKHDGGYFELGYGSTSRHESNLISSKMERYSHPTDSFSGLETYVKVEQYFATKAPEWFTKAHQLVLYVARLALFMTVKMTQPKAEALLTPNTIPGTYLIRRNSTRPNAFVLTVKVSNTEVRHWDISHDILGGVFTLTGGSSFSTLDTLISYYSQPREGAYLGHCLGQVSSAYDGILAAIINENASVLREMQDNNEPTEAFLKELSETIRSSISSRPESFGLEIEPLYAPPSFGFDISQDTDDMYMYIIPSSLQKHPASSNFEIPLSSVTGNSMSPNEAASIVSEAAVGCFLMYPVNVGNQFGLTVRGCDGPVHLTVVNKSGMWFLDELGCPKFPTLEHFVLYYRQHELSPTVSIKLTTLGAPLSLA